MCQSTRHRTGDLGDPPPVYRRYSCRILSNESTFYAKPDQHSRRTRPRFLGLTQGANIRRSFRVTHHSERSKNDTCTALQRRLWDRDIWLHLARMAQSRHGNESSLMIPWAEALSRRPWRV